MKNNKNHKFLVLFKKELFTLLLQSGTYIASFVFLFGFAISFFIFGGFFTYNQTVDLKNFFSFFPFLLIVFIPLISFNIFKKENLFFTFAISDFFKIFAKFLALFIIFACNVFITIFNLFFVSRFGSLDFSQIFTIYFILFLYGAMLISFSIFIQVLFENKIASISVLFALLAVFNIIHILPKYCSINNEAFLSLIKFISFSSHFENATKGIFSIGDVLFYIILTIAFLFFSVKFMQKKSGKKFFTLKTALVFGIFLFCLIDSSLLNSNFDFTKNKEFSLTKSTKQICKNNFETINITYAYSKELKTLYPQINDIIDFLFLYARENPNINVYAQKVDNDKTLQKKLSSLNITSQEFPSKNNSDRSINSFYSAIIIETETDCKTIPFVFSLNGLEYLVTQNIAFLENGKNLSAIVICKNGLSLNDDYSYLVPYLESAGISVFDDIEIMSLANTNVEVPIIFIGGSEISDLELVELENEIERGRKFLFFTNPYKLDIYGDWKIVNDKNPVLALLFKYGIKIFNSFVLDENCFEMTMQNQNYNSEYTKIKYPFWVVSDGKTFYWPSPVELKNDTIDAKVIVQTSDLGFEKEVKTKDFETSPFSKENFNANINTYGKHNLVVANDKMIVVSDQYFNSNMITYTNSIKNLDFTVDSVICLNGADYLVELKNKTLKDLSFSKIKTEEEFYSCRAVTIFFCIFFIPIFAVLLVFICVFFARKMKK